MAVRSGSARWTGNLAQGAGTVSTETGTLANAPYSFRSRFEQGGGTNPEELLAAAHAGCFSMAFAHALSSAGHVPDEVATTAKVHLQQKDGGFAIPLVELATVVKVNGPSDADVQKIADGAKAGCPVSKLFAGAEIRLQLTRA